MTWDVSINGAPLNTEGSGVEEITGLGGIAGRDFFNQSAYAMDGESSVIGGLTAGVFGLKVWVYGVDRTSGAVPSGSTAQIQAQKNFDWMVSHFVTDYLLSVAVNLPGASTLTLGQRTRVCDAQLVTMSSPTWNDTRTACQITLGFKIPGVYWRAAGGDGLDASGYKTITVAAGVTTLTLPTDVYSMTGFIEDAIITVNSGTNPIRSVGFKALNRGSGSVGPEMIFSAVRTNGVLYASSNLVMNCQKHTAVHTSGAVAESVMKFADYHGGRPGSMLRIGAPYQLQATFLPYTTGASMAAVTWSIKYRPSFI